jgi:hypothetical protein
MAMRATSNASSDEAALRIRNEAARLVLLVSERDSAWFADVASKTQLELSGPGRTGPRGMGFLTGLKLLGDTSLVLGLQGGGRMYMHDALYEIAKDKLLDLMLIDLADAPDLRAGVRTLLSYIATDVGSNVPLILGVQTPTPQLGDTVSVLLRAAFANAAECVARTQNASPVPPSQLHLFFHPSVRLSCQSATALPGDPTAISARLIVLN